MKVAELEAALRQYQGEAVKLTLLVDRRTMHRRTLEVLEAASNAGISRVYLATRTRARGGEEP